MGINDRDYSREYEPGFHLKAPTTVTMQLIVITGVAYLAQLAFPAFVQQYLVLKCDWFLQPWTVYQLISYGFLHSPDDIGHILVNMLILWMFGREIEARYGKREFIFFYLAAMISAGVIWSLSEYGAGSKSPDFGRAVQLVNEQGQLVGLTRNVPSMVGASGALAALVVLFAFNWPHRQVLFFFILPMPMWVAAAIGILFDVKGAMDRSGNVAFTAHLGGALFGLLYYKAGWNLSQWLPDGLAAPKWPRRGPNLRVHDPESEPADDLSQQVDRILQKIQEQGQDSLTWKERRTLEKASKEYQERRK